MKYVVVFFLQLLSFHLLSQSCKGMPFFILNHGFDPGKTVFSSQEIRKRGVVMIQLGSAQDPKSVHTKEFQDPSWQDAGYVGSITTGRNGDIYVLPKANVNQLYNPYKDQNTVFRIESKSGKMEKWLSLPMNALPHDSNASGLMSAYYDCDADHLIVSTIAGSSQKQEIGTVYSIDVATKSYHPIIQNKDILGILTARLGTEKRLFFGLCRNSEIYSIALDSKNFPVGEARFEISLEGLGPRGDDKVRKMRMDQSGILKVAGVPFFYNLTAPVERQETNYTFRYNSLDRTWKLVELK